MTLREIGCTPAMAPSSTAPTPSRRVDRWWRLAASGRLAHQDEAYAMLAAADGAPLRGDERCRRT